MSEYDVSRAVHTLSDMREEMLRNMEQHPEKLDTFVIFSTGQIDGFCKFAHSLMLAREYDVAHEYALQILAEVLYVAEKMKKDSKVNTEIIEA